MKLVFISFLLGIVLIALTFFGSYWLNTQPIWVIDSPIDSTLLNTLPVKNKQILELVESNGRRMAPTYEDVVCTEFVIKVIDTFEPLTKVEKNEIRIITSEDLNSLIQKESATIKGIQTALVKSRKGVEIVNSEDAQSGDFVQLWNVYQDKVYGHCGVVYEVDPNNSITLYSSHPLTNGYGKQKYLWPDKAYFVRLK